MNRPALDLLARTLLVEIGSERCAGCGRPLATSRVSVQEEAGRVSVKLSCRGCGEALILGVEPGGADGVARVR